MTVRNMVEVIRELHPTVGRTQAIFDLNDALLSFARYTRLLTTHVQLVPADKTSIDANNRETRWQLPDDVYEILTIDKVDSNAYRLDGDTLVVEWLNQFVDRLAIDYIRKPAAIALDGDVPEIPNEFHYGLVACVIEKYYARDAKNIQAALYWGQKYRERLIEAKKYSNTRYRRNEGVQAGGGSTITDYQTGLSLVQGVNTITMTKTFTDTESYAIYLNGNGVTVTEYTDDENEPHKFRTTSSFQVFSADDIDGSFDYIVTGT